MTRFSWTVRSAKRRRRSGTRARPPRTISWGLPGRGLPPKRISPDVGFSTPDRVHMIVDLPAPLAPTMETISRLPTPKVTSRTAWIFP